MSDHGNAEKISGGSDPGQFEELLHSIDGIVWEADAATFEFTFVSEKAVQMLGYPIADWYSSSEFWVNTIHPDDRAWAVNFCQTALKKGEDHQFEYRMIAADGRIVWLRDIVSLSTSNDGSVLMRGVMFDITELKHTEKELSVLQKRLEATLENTPNVAIQWYNEKGIVQYWNPASERVFGWTAKEATGKSLAETIHDQKEADEFIELLGQVAESGSSVGPNEYQFKRKDGSTGYCSSTIFSIPGANGRPYFVCMDVDITQQRDAENDRSELVFKLGERVKELSALHSVARILQQPEITLEQVLREVVMILPPSLQEPRFAEARIRIGSLEESTENFPSTTVAIRSQFETGDSRSGFVEIAYPDEFAAAEGHQIFLDEEHSLIATVSDMLRVFYDRRISEERLIFSEERFRQLAENIREVFWIHLPGAKEIIYVSPAYEIVWGRSVEEVYADPLSFTYAILPEDLDDVLKNLEKGKTAGFESEYRIRRPDGSIRWIWDRGFPVRDENGEVYRVAGIAEDITERKRLEDQLVQSQKMEAIGQLAGGIAHDFNNLLTAIIGYSDLVLRKLSADDPIVKHVEEIRRSGNRAASLTRQLLAFSRKQILQPRVLDLNQVIEEIEQLLRRLAGERTDLRFNLDPSIGRVRADPGQIEQVIINLILNARDAMPHNGRILIETKCVLAVDEPAWDIETNGLVDLVAISVSDTGTGIEPEILEKIYEPFFTTKETGKGTGLGLSTVYGIIQQSGGAISVESTVGTGTKFKVLFPQIEGSAPTEDRSLRLGNAKNAGPCVLVVEDEQVVRDLIGGILESEGYTVLVAEDGIHALDQIARSGAEIDLLITDLVMPEMSGQELAERLTLANSDVRVLFMSGHLEHDLDELLKSNEQSKFIQKPFDPRAFTEMVSSFRLPANP